MFNRIRGNSGASQPTAPSAQGNQGVNLAATAGATAQEAASEKEGKGRVALGAAGLLAAGVVVAGVAVPAVAACKTKKAGITRVVNPLATAVGEWVMDGTTPLQRRLPAIGAKPAQGQEFDL
jgi:hypothetical protein